MGGEISSGFILLQAVNLNESPSLVLRHVRPKGYKLGTRWGLDPSTMDQAI